MYLHWHLISPLHLVKKFRLTVNNIKIMYVYNLQLEMPFIWINIFIALYRNLYDNVRNDLDMSRSEFDARYIAEHKTLFQYFKRYAVSYLHSTNLKYRIQQQSLHLVYMYNVSEDVKFDNYQRFVERFVGLSECQTNELSDYWGVGL